MPASSCVISTQRLEIEGLLDRAQIGRDWSAPHSPVAALGGGVTYHPHRSETKALHTYGAPSSTRFGNFGSDPLTYGFESSRKTRDAFIRFTVDQA